MLGYKLTHCSEVLRAWCILLWIGISIPLTTGNLHAGIVTEAFVGAEEYNEQLTIKPLHNNDLLLNFQYTFERPLIVAPQTHFSVFPRGVAELLDSTGVTELSVSLTQGRWHQERWGLPITSTPTGAEVWGRFEGSNMTEAETDESWQSVTQGLAGLLCASLNFIQPENTGKPVMLFGAEGSDGRLGAGSPYRYATLSRENVCTENLTPLVKLLPCRAKAGLASMMNAYTVFDSLFSALSVHVSTECVDDTCEYKKQVLVLAVNVVPTRVNQEPSQPLPKQYHWNLGDLLKAALNSACAVATNSEVKIVTTDWLGVKRITLNKAPSHTVEHGVYAIDVYPVVFGEGLDLSGTVLAHSQGHTAHEPYSPVAVHQALTGYGQQKGGLTVIIANHQDSATEVTFYHTIPSFVRVYFHTLAVNCADCDETHPIMTHRRLAPSRDRQRPMEIEIRMNLPARTTTTVSLDFEKAMIRASEHPPDANRGFDVGAVVIEFELSPSEFPFNQAGRGCYRATTPFRYRLHSETLVVPMPVPDFSMPYNVVVLTSTVLTLSFGFVYNISTRIYRRVET